VSNIEKNPLVKQKIKEEEVDRINVSQLTDISGGMMPPKKSNKNSYMIYDAQMDHHNEEDQNLLETIENEDLDDAFGEDFDQQSLSRGEENILNNSLDESHNLYDNQRRSNQFGNQDDTDDLEEENLYQTNNFEDVDFMNEDLDQDVDPVDKHLEVLKDLGMDSGRRGMGAPKNSIINLVNRNKNIKKKNSQYNLYNKSKTKEIPKMSKNKNHRSQANFHHKRTKTGLSSTGNGFLQQVANKSQNKNRKNQFGHNNSGEQLMLGQKGYSTQRIPPVSQELRGLTHQNKLHRKKSHNKGRGQQNLRIDTHNTQNYHSK
jgi:hypothetical protein